MSVMYNGVGGWEEWWGWVDGLSAPVDTSNQALHSLGDRNSHGTPRPYHKPRYVAVWHPMLYY